MKQAKSALIEYKVGRLRSKKTKYPEIFGSEIGYGYPMFP